MADRAAETEAAVICSVSASASSAGIAASHFAAKPGRNLSNHIANDPDTSFTASLQSSAGHLCPRHAPQSVRAAVECSNGSAMRGKCHCACSTWLCYVFRVVEQNSIAGSTLQMYLM